MADEQNYYQPFPIRLRQLLEENNVSQQELADFVGVKRQTVAQWKDGKTAPDIHNFKRIVEFFQLPYDFILGDTDSRVKENIDIAETLGLSDEAIEMLKKWQEQDNQHVTEIGYTEIISDLVSCPNFEKILNCIHQSINEYIGNQDYNKNKILYEAQLYTELKGRVGAEYFIDHSYISEADLLARKEGKRLIDTEDLSHFYRFKASELFEKIVYDMPETYYKAYFSDSEQDNMQKE